MSASAWLHDVERDLARTEDELSRLRHAGLLISSRQGLEQTLEAILQMALEVTDAHYGIFRLVDPGGQNLITRALAGDHLDRPLVEALGGLGADRDSAPGLCPESVRSRSGDIAHSRPATES